MSTTTGINGSTTLSTSGTTLQPTANSGTGSSNALGENDFLQLMMAQLQNQDPLSPSDPSQYMSELAQFTSLEQEMNISTTTAASATQQSNSGALALLGHTVSYTDSNGNALSGTVSKVDFSSSGPTLTIGGVSGITLSSITEAQ
jgi:flagellar basal-body rod modification protein FlgD